MIREKIKQILKKALKDAREIKIEYPSDEKFGDYATNIAFVLAKAESKSPREFAESLVSKISGNKKTREIFEKAEAAGSGFINFTVSKNFLQNELKEYIARPTPRMNIGRGKKLNIEFLSANPTGKFQVGNGRGGFYGDVLGNVLKLAGYAVKKEYYINNAKSSNQIQELGKTALGAGDKYLTDYVLEKIEKIKPAICAGSSPAHIGEAGYLLAEEIHKDSRKFLEEKAGIHYDVWTEEQKLHEEGRLEEALKILEKKGLIYEKEGAKWLRTTDFGDDKDKVIVRSNGEYGYFLADIAYHLDKKKRGFKVIIDVFGADHQGHVEPMKIAMNILDYDGKFEVLVTQLVQAKGGGRFSKRAGNVIPLEELIDEVGADAARFFYLMKSIDTQIEFDFDLAKEQSEKNPVYYVQYAYARMNSILENSKTKIQKPKFKGQNFNLLNHESELKLIKYLIRWSEVVEDTAKDFEVHRIIGYATGLSSVFNGFYRDCRVISDDKDLTIARLGLVIAAKNVLKEVLESLGISAPEYM